MRAFALLLIATLAPTNLWADSSGREVPTFKVDLSGMIGFVKTNDGGLLVLLVNELTQIAHGDVSMAHLPELEISCDDLRLPADEADCAMLARSQNLRRRRIALDNSSDARPAAGWEIVLHVGGATMSGEVCLPTDHREWLVPLDELSDGIAARSLLSREVLSNVSGSSYAIVRLKLNGGRLELHPEDRGGFVFKNAAGKVYITPSRLAGSATWSIPYDPALGARIDLVSLETGRVERSFDLQSDSSRDSIEIGLTNEPDAFSFCGNALSKPTDPLGHFLGFLDITAQGLGSEHDELKKLPLPFVQDSTKFCKYTPGAGGRRVNCMMVLYSGIEPY